jgi:hypothetical protein
MVGLDSLPFEKGRLRGIYLCDPYRRGRFFINGASFSHVCFGKINPLSCTQQISSLFFDSLCLLINEHGWD